jgi:putative membrane protein
MKLKLSAQDRKRLDSLIPEMEKRTKTQVVLAVIERSDSYAELPWKAFALGASVTGLLLFIFDLFSVSWNPQLTVLSVVAAFLAGGAVSALLTLLIPGFARQFLSASRCSWSGSCSLPASEPEYWCWSVSSSRKW